MRAVVTKIVLVSSALSMLAGCSNGGGGKAAVCSVAPRTASDQGVLRWKADLPPILRFDFTRDQRGAWTASPRCVKTPDQILGYSKFVEASTGPFGGADKLRFTYDYLLFPKSRQNADLDLSRDGSHWVGQFTENTLLRFGRTYDIRLPSCTDVELAKPELIEQREADGRLTRLQSLTANNSLICQ